MKPALISVVVLIILAAGYLAYAALIANPRVERELRKEPDGERARKVMLITLPSGKTIPVNYLREGDVVYAGADGRWWRELRGDGARVELLVRGETLTGRARAIEDDPDHRADVFSRLRPTAPKFTGTLVQIDLAPGA
jgi:hypothetical protein